MLNFLLLIQGKVFVYQIRFAMKAFEWKKADIYKTLPASDSKSKQRSTLGIVYNTILVPILNNTAVNWHERYIIQDKFPQGK